MRARAITTFSLLCLTLAGAAGLQAQEKKASPERYTAVAIGTGGHDTLPVATPLDIVIERWSTDAERVKVLDALKKGQDAALSAIMKLRSVGYLRTPNSTRWDFTYIEQVPDKEGGRRILMAVDRDISFAEAVNLTPSSKYPFAFVELHLSKDGTGRGRLSRASSAWSDPSGKYIVTENYESAPIEITQIKPRK